MKPALKTSGIRGWLGGPAARGDGLNDHLMHQMAARGFRNILRVALVALVFALIQMLLFQQVCNQGLKAATDLERDGLPNLDQLADLREKLVLFRLYSYDFLFTSDSRRTPLEQAANDTERQIHEELEQLKTLHHSPQGRRLAMTLDSSVTELAEAFAHMRRLTDKDFAGALKLLNDDLSPKIQAVNNAAIELDRFGHQLSGAEARANLEGFAGIKRQAIFWGTTNTVVAMGLVLFVLMAARKTHGQLAGALEQINQQGRTLRLQASALDAAANAILITDRAGVIEWANPAFAKLTGYSLEETMGKNPRLLKSDQHTAQFYVEMWKTILSGGEWSGELVNRRKDGTLYHEEMYITSVRREDGKIQNFIAVKHDISNRHRLQQALEHEKKLLYSLMDNLPDFIYFKDEACRFTRINLAMTRHLGLQQPDEAIGKTEDDFIPSFEARQKRVDEQRMMLAGQPIIGLVEESGTPTGRRWVSTTKVPLRGENGSITGMVGVSRDLTHYKQVEVERLEMQGRYRMLFESSVEAILITDEKAILDCNPAALKVFHYPDKSEMVFRPPTEFLPSRQPDGTDSATAFRQRMAEAFERGSTQFEFYFQRQTGELFPTALSLTAFRQGAKKLLQAALHDLTQLKRAEKERQLMEVQLRQAQKLESIGQLAAGIAHEINTPTQYIGDNTRFLREAFDAIIEMMRDYHQLLGAAKAAACLPEPIARIEAALVRRDMEFLCAQVPTAIQETLEGVDRVSKIVRAMKEFSHPGGTKVASNLNKALESTITVARNEWRYVADLELKLDPDLPLVSCFLGEFNQAVLNLIVNAAHAINDVIKLKPGTKGLITVQTRHDGDQVEVRVSDTGTGIPEAVRPKIFDPFFTTKDVGKGTGQGLAIVYGAIVSRLGGSVNFETEMGRGTTFILRLPVKAAREPEPVAALKI